MMNTLLTLVVGVVCATSPGAAPVSGIHSHIPAPAAANETCLDLDFDDCTGVESIMDPAALKRARNKIAAKKCRLKRKARQENIDDQVATLTKQNADLHRENETLKTLVQRLQADLPTNPALTGIIEVTDEETIANASTDGLDICTDLLDFPSGLIFDEFDSQEGTNSQKRAKHEHSTSSDPTAVLTSTVLAAALVSSAGGGSKESEAAASDSGYSSSDYSSAGSPKASVSSSEGDACDDEWDLTTDIANVELTTDIGDSLLVDLESLHWT